ncbi:MAG: vWA domain-containing protein [Candidatus Binataceae bacterium]
MSFDAAVALAVTFVIGSIFLFGFALYRRAAQREAQAESRREVDEAGVDRLQRIKDGLRLLAGPFPLSIALHAAALLLLIIVFNTRPNPQMLPVSVAVAGSESPNAPPKLDVPAAPMPDISPPEVENLPVTNNSAVNNAEHFVRYETNPGGIGTFPNGDIGYQNGIGTTFGGYIHALRGRGLDVMLVIDGTGSMNLVIGDVKARMKELAATIHRLVPIARVGIIVYGGPNDPLQIQPLTLSHQKLESFLGNIKAGGGGEWSENMLGACRTAIDQTQWKPYAKKVIVLVGDSPPAEKDFAPLLQLVRRFKSADKGTFNTVDVTPEEHERFDRELSIQLHGTAPNTKTPPPEFDRQTDAAFKVIASNGGGSMRPLTGNAYINQQVLLLIFGNRWKDEVARYGKDIARAAK